MKKILVIDDEIQLRELLRKVLLAEGFDVVAAPLAAQGLERVFQEPFDLVLLDLKLTDEPGMSVLKKIRASNAKIPVVIYSGTLTAEIEKEAKAAGATEVLAKGVGIAPLTAQIKKILNAGDRLGSDARPRSEKKILFVDDEAGVRGVLLKFFKEKGYSVLEAESGERALQVVSSENVSVVLLDMEMPGMDGLATLKKLLEINPKLGVVMATGVQSDERVKSALELGAYGYVLKPFDFLYLDLVVTSRLSIADASGPSEI